MIRIIAAANALALVAHLEVGHAVEFEPLAKALMALLSTPKVVKKTVPMGASAATAYFSKGSDGRAEKLAFVERGIYPPNCTHTWAIGVDPRTGAVTGIRVIEMSCPHAFPTRQASFLDQYAGKGPADAATLSKKINTIAKATGSSNLTTDAVKRSIEAFGKLKGRI